MSHHTGKQVVISQKRLKVCSNKLMTVSIEVSVVAKPNRPAVDTIFVIQTMAKPVAGNPERCKKFLKFSLGTTPTCPRSSLNLSTHCRSKGHNGEASARRTDLPIQLPDQRSGDLDGLFPLRPTSLRVQRCHR